SSRACQYLRSCSWAWCFWSTGATSSSRAVKPKSRCASPTFTTEVYSLWGYCSHCTSIREKTPSLQLPRDSFFCTSTWHTSSSTTETARHWSHTSPSRFSFCFTSLCDSRRTDCPYLGNIGLPTKRICLEPISAHIDPIYPPHFG